MAIYGGSIKLRLEILVHDCTFRIVDEDFYVSNLLTAQFII